MILMNAYACPVVVLALLPFFFLFLCVCFIVLYIKKKLVSKLKLATYSDVNGKPSGPKIATNSGAYIYILYYIYITLLHFEYGGGGWWE
jgi:hypothetical protein